MRNVVQAARGHIVGISLLVLIIPSRFQSRANQIQNMLDRARQREEPKLHFTDVIHGVVGPIYLRTLFAIGGLDRAYLAALVERTINAPVRLPDTFPCAFGVLSTDLT